MAIGADVWLSAWRLKKPEFLALAEGPGGRGSGDVVVQQSAWTGGDGHSEDQRKGIGYR